MAIEVTESPQPLSRDWNTIATDINTKILREDGNAAQRIEWAIQNLAAGPRATDGETGPSRSIWESGEIPQYFTDIFTGADVGMQREIIGILPPTEYNRAHQKSQREVYPALAKELYRKLYKTVKVKDKEGNETEETEEVPDRGHFLKEDEPPTEEQTEFNDRIEALAWSTFARQYLLHSNDDGTGEINALMDSAPELFDIIVNNYPKRILNKRTYNIGKVFPDLEPFLAQPYKLNPHEYTTLRPGETKEDDNITGIYNLHNEEVLNEETGQMEIEPAPSKYKIGPPPDPDDPQAVDERQEFVLGPEEYLALTPSRFGGLKPTIECTEGSIEVDTDMTGRARPGNLDVFLALMLFNDSNRFRGASPFNRYFSDHMYVGGIAEDFQTIDLNELRDIAVEWMQSRMMWVTLVTSKTSNQLIIPLLDHHKWKVGSRYAMAVYAGVGGGDRCVSIPGAVDENGVRSAGVPQGGPGFPTGYRHRLSHIGNANAENIGPWLQSCPIYPNRYHGEVTNITPHVIEPNSQEIITRGSVTIEFDRPFTTINGARGDNEIIQQMIDARPLPVTEGDFAFQPSVGDKPTGSVLFTVRLSFLKLLPLAFEDGNDFFNVEDDFALSTNFSDAQFYLRAAATGFCRPREHNPDSGGVEESRQLTHDGTNVVGTNGNGDLDSALRRMCDSPRPGTIIKDFTIERYYETLGTHEPVVSLNRKDNMSYPGTNPGTLLMRQTADMSNALRRYKGFVPNAWYQWVVTTRHYALLSDNTVGFRPGDPQYENGIHGVSTGIRVREDPVGGVSQLNERPAPTPWEDLSIPLDISLVAGNIRQTPVGTLISAANLSGYGATSTIFTRQAFQSVGPGSVREIEDDPLFGPREVITQYWFEYAQYTEYEISLNIGFWKEAYPPYDPHDPDSINPQQDPSAWQWLAEGLGFEYCIRDFRFQPDTRDPEQRAYWDERKFHEGGKLVLGAQEWWDMSKANEVAGEVPSHTVFGEGIPRSFSVRLDFIAPKVTSSAEFGTQYIIDIEPERGRVIPPRPEPPPEDPDEDDQDERSS